MSAGESGASAESEKAEDWVVPSALDRLGDAIRGRHLWHPSANRSLVLLTTEIERLEGLHSRKESSVTLKERAALAEQIAKVQCELAFTAERQTAEFGAEVERLTKQGRRDRAVWKRYDETRSLWIGAWKGAAESFRRLMAEYASFCDAGRDCMDEGRYSEAVATSRARLPDTAPCSLSRSRSSRRKPASRWPTSTVVWR